MKILYKVKNWITQNPKEAILLTFILLLGAFLRLYKIDQYMTFLGDEGRDAIVVRKLLLYADPILVGPGTSIGNMYLGPLYYYFMAPFLFLSNYSPVGPATGVALLGVATVFLVWFVAKKLFGKNAAIVASSLYAISPIVIIYSRSSWNPNIMPFFSLLCIYSIWCVWKNYDYKWLIILGVSFAFCLQSHYLGLLLAPVLGLYWLLALVRARKDKLGRKYIVYSFFSLLIFIILMSPLVIFDARHGWRNLDAIKVFFTQRQTTVSIRPWSALPKTIPLYEKVISRLAAGKIDIVAKFVALVSFLPLFWVMKNKKQNESDSDAFILILVWLAVALVGMGLYKQEIYDHYFGFIFAAPFLLLGGISEVLIRKSRIRGTSLVVVGVFILVVANLLDSPLRYPPNMQLVRTEKVAQRIIELSNKEDFNFAIIAERNYDAAYRYFLEAYNHSPMDIDPQRHEETVAKQLLVVCEMSKEKCDPTHNPKAEVANFGWSKIEYEEDYLGTRLYILGHTK